uniref:N-terminal Ras-GEF domain-containing protein n=1 Tax=Caenorhabditis japonica TaxID=281687 RepID=A0A8R1J439_CAEJA
MNAGKILHQVESNTVRLREYGEDVLVLEKVDIPRGAALENSDSGSFNCGYSVMAGKAQKILEYVLETRIDALVIDELDQFLEDFLLTHDAFMPDNTVCNFLKSYYFRPQYKSTQSALAAENGASFSFNEEIRSKRRVVQFVSVWCSLLRINFFLNPVTNSFVEELFCLVIEDRKRLEGMDDIVARMATIRA